MNPQTQTTPTAQFPSFGQLPGPLSNLATTQANWLTGQIGQPGRAYQGAMAAPLSSGQVAQIAGAGQLAGPWMGTAGPTAAATNQLLSGQINPFTGMAMGGPAAQATGQLLSGQLNPFTGQAAQTPQAIQNILGGSTMPGQSPYIQGVLGQLGQQEAQDIQALHSTYGAGPGVNAALGQMQGNIMANYANQAMAQLLAQQNAATQQQLQAAPLAIQQQQVPYQAWQQAQAAQQQALPYQMQLQGMPYQAFQQAQANQLAALGQGAALPQAALSQLGAAGGLQQQAMQNYLTAAYQDWLRQQQQPWQAAGLAAPLAERAFTPIGQETTTTPSIMSQLFGGAAAAAAGGAFG
jgi:hypothetical protein